MGLFWFRQTKLLSSIGCFETGVGTESPRGPRGFAPRLLPPLVPGRAAPPRPPQLRHSLAALPGSVGAVLTRGISALCTAPGYLVHAAGCGAQPPGAGSRRGAGPERGPAAPPSAAPPHRCCLHALPDPAAGGFWPNAQLPAPSSLRGGSCSSHTHPLAARALRARWAARLPHGAVTTPKALGKIRLLGVLGAVLDAACTTQGAILGG